MMWFSSDGPTPLGGKLAPLEDIVATPVELHDYREEQDISFGYWVRFCLTCNRFFGYGGATEHRKYFEQAVKKHTFMVKRQVLLEKASD